MGKKKKRWVRLKRAIQKMKLVDPNTIKGDGGLMTEDFLNRINNNKDKSDSTFVVKDSAVVAREK